MTPAQLGKSLRCNVFADRGTDIQAALDYALELAKASDDPPAMLTAVHVVVNTIANALIDMGDNEQPRGKFE